MSSIRFFYKPEKPVDYSTLKIQVSGNDFSDFFTENDKRIMTNVWEELRRERGDKVFSRPRGLGCLVDTTHDTLTFRPTDFMTYVATSTTYSTGNQMNQGIYDNMKVSAVGGIVRLADGSVFIHKRSGSVTHAKNAWDSSVAGLAHIDDTGEPNFMKAILEKLRRELKIRDGEIKNLAVTGIHSSYDPDFSGMVDFLVETSLEADNLEERIDKNYFGETAVVTSNLLPYFAVMHYAVDGDMIGDGCATILASLDHNKFIDIVDALKEYRKTVEFGFLNKGSFVPSAL